MRIILNIGMGGREPRAGRAAMLAAACAALALLAPSAARAVDDPAEGAGDATGPLLAVERSLSPLAAAAPLEHGKAFTGDATTVDPGHVEVELAYAPAFWTTAGAVDRAAGDQHALYAAVTVGLLPGLDARVVSGWALVHATPVAPGAPGAGAGPADTMVAARWRFLSLAEPAVDLAVSVAVTLPTSTPATPDHLGTGQDAWSLGGALLASADWWRFTASAELGVSVPASPSPANDAALLACNAALGYQLLPWLQPEVELNYQHEVELGPERDERILWATAALVMPLDVARVVVGVRAPIWSQAAAAGPMATAAIKLAF